MRKMMLAAAVLLLMAGCGTVEQSDPLEFALGGRKPGPALDRLVAEASKHALGSEKNPVRVNMPAGQREYLSRLRCSNGSPPTFNRVGNFGQGVYGSIIDGYRVVCERGEPKESMIYMDMYHPQHHETAAPPGFVLVPPGTRQNPVAA